MISIKNLSFSYDDKIIFNNLNLTIKNNITTIIGLNGSGKSTLIKILSGLLDYKGTIRINKLILNKENIVEIRKKIGVVFENSDSQFVCEKVLDDLIFTLSNMGFDKYQIEDKIRKIVEALDINNLLNHDPHSLNTNDKQLVCLALALVHEPKILILDEALNMLNPIVKDKVLDLLVKLNKKGLSIINITHDIEQTLISNEIIVIDKGKVLLKGSKDEIFKNEKQLKELGFKLPFMVELSNRLIFYNLIDHIIYDMKEMVDILWK